MSEENPLVQKLIASLNENDKLKRKHADFFNYYKKESKEAGIFSEVFKTFETMWSSKIVEWDLEENDPPDVYVKLENSKINGIEITELVNEKAIKAQTSGSNNYFKILHQFDYSAAVQELHKILAKKEEKLSNKKTEYNELVLLIHTDEFELKFSDFKDKGREIFPEGSSVFDKIFILFSYEPSEKQCPLVQLK